MKRIFLHASICLILLSGIPDAHPQSIRTQDGLSIEIETISISDGISDTRVNRIIQDRKGMLWFATLSGLNRYDGYHFKRYLHNPNDSTSIPHNYISDLIEDKQGNIWLGFSTGWSEEGGNAVAKFNPETEQFTSYDMFPKGIEPDSRIDIYRITETQDGFLWFSLSRDNDNIFLARLNPENEEITYFHHDPNDPNSLTDGIIRTFYEDRRGNIWIGSGVPWDGRKKGGLNLFHPESGTFTRYEQDASKPKSIQDFSVFSAYEDRKGNFWVGTGSKGLYRMDRETAVFIPFHLEEKELLNRLPQRVEAIYEDSYDRLWIGGAGKTTLTIHDPSTSKTWEITRDEIAFCQDIFEDKSGSIWVVSGHESGLHKIRLVPQLLERISSVSNNENQTLRGRYINSAWGLEKALDQNFWITTDAGLTLFDPVANAEKSFFSIPDSMSLGSFSSIAQEDANILWGKDSNQANRLYRIDLQQFEQSIQKPFHNFHHYIWQIFLSQHGELWVGLGRVGHTLWKWDQGSKEFIEMGKGIFVNSDINLIIEDRQGTIWIGASNGLFEYQAASDSFVKIYDRSIRRLWEGTDGKIWMGTQNYGLWFYDPLSKDLVHFGREEGLLGTAVLGLWGDERDNLWLITNGGFSKYEAASQSFLHFPIEQYASYNPINTFFVPIIEDAKGAPYYVTSNSLIKINTAITQESTTPQTLLKEIRTAEDTISLFYKENQALIFPYDQNDLQIEYVGLNTLTPPKSTYSYWLENSDKAWVEAKTSRAARYNDLKPGTYVFRVKCKSSEGVWSEEASISIKILPPWWQTWWAYTLYVLMGAGLAFGTFQWRTISLRRQRQLLRTRVFEQTQEIRAEQARAEDLLLNILPITVAKELKASGKTQPVFYEEVSILFADFKGFTNIVASIPGKKLVQELDEIFQAYDDIVEEVGLEKIQTVGDAYLAACGVPEPDPNHAIKCVEAAKKIIAYLETRNESASIKWQVRLGIHTGPITAGVIGKKKFSYDLFGDTINVAARMESASEAGKINVSAYTHSLIRDTFACTYRGKIDAKGKGELDMYFVD